MDNSEANIHEAETLRKEAKTRKEVKIREEKQTKKPIRTLPAIFGFRPLRTIVVLLAIILLLLYLFWFYGLGSGGGKALPGPSNSPNFSLETPTEEPRPKETQDKPSARRELSISFIPSESDGETAKELTCNMSWTDVGTGSRENRLVSEDNMPDFEFTLEKGIRAWHTAPGSTKQDTLVVVICMMPFPGEGTLQKMTKIIHEIDPRISILRLEK